MFVAHPCMGGEKRSKGVGGQPHISGHFEAILGLIPVFSMI